MICWHDVSNNSMMENAGIMTHFSFAYEKVNKTDSVLSSGCNRPLVATTITIDVFTINFIHFIDLINNAS